MAGERYACIMVLFAAAAALLATPQTAPVTDAGASAQARVSIRILSAAMLRLGEGSLRGDARIAQATQVHLDGAAQPAKLIEFE